MTSPADSTDVSESAVSAFRTWWRRQCSLREMAGFLVSLLAHIALLVILSLLVWGVPTEGEFTLIVASKPGDELLADEDAELQEIAVDSEMAFSDNVPDTLLEPEPLAPLEADAVSPDMLADDSSDLLELARTMPLDTRLPTGGGFSGRSADRRGEMLGREGGTGESERAVALALEWLAAHQYADGGWRFTFDKGPCQGRCRDPGTVGTSTGATGLALLPFLGAGFTHQEGKYRDLVHEGLYFLKGHMIPTDHGGDLQEGTMYAQGIATIALCEAYAMTRDKSLRPTAQDAVDFICHAQHSGGGWRYWPGEPGDTTVTGWQMMALKSAYMAGLEVPSLTFGLSERFLDSVQSGNGAFYGYQARTKRPSTTAVGLLVRMYSGWRQDDERLLRGVSFIAGRRPSKSDMYFNYYATQVIHHVGGPAWPRWNEAMREYLIATQSEDGHERGSWHFADPHGNVGGRLYSTAMCAMILEVYYRHMPLYAKQAVEDGL